MTMSAPHGHDWRITCNCGTTAYAPRMCKTKDEARAYFSTCQWTAGAVHMCPHCQDKKRGKAISITRIGPLCCAVWQATCDTCGATVTSKANDKLQASVEFVTKGWRVRPEKVQCPNCRRGECHD